MSLSVLCGRAGAPLDLSMVVVFISRPCSTLRYDATAGLRVSEMSFPCRSGDLGPRYLTPLGAALILFCGACIGQGEVWDEIGYASCVQGWPVALLAYHLLREGDLTA